MPFTVSIFVDRCSVCPNLRYDRDGDNYCVELDGWYIRDVDKIHRLCPIEPEKGDTLVDE